MEDGIEGRGVKNAGDQVRALVLETGQVEQEWGEQEAVKKGR